MSELKWNWVYYPYLDAPNKQEESALKAGYIKVVIKDEADAVIKELKDKALQYKVLNEEHCRDLNTQERFFAEQIAHQKYKRCLAMAKWCMTEYLHSKCLDFTNTEQWYWRRWHIRWRNLANKFKEAK